MDDKRMIAAKAQSSKAVAVSEWPVSDLPQCLIMDILSRLSIKTLFICRCVCKTWLALFSDPHFINLQHINSPFSLMMYDSKSLQLVQANTRAPRFHAEKTKLSLKFNFSLGILYLVNSCNGLLCIVEPRVVGTVYVCNPILGEHIAIPLANDPLKQKHCTRFALGFCAETNEYKVVATFYRVVGRGQGYSNEAEIYTVGTGEWRSLGNAPCSFSHHRIPVNSFLNGCIHWIARGADGYDHVFSFDFGSEEFRPVPLPSHFDRKRKNLSGFVVLGVLQRSLSLIVFSNNKYDIWVMKDYGITESWTKLFSIESLLISNMNWYDVFEPITVLDSGEILMMCNDETFVCYDPNVNVLRDAEIDQAQNNLHAVAYIPCFVSLEGIAEAEEVVISRYPSIEA